MAAPEAKTKVYVAIPDSESSRALRSHLEAAGCRIQEAMDWSLIPEEVGLWGADLVVLAHRLPGVDVRFVLAQLKEDPRTRDRSVLVVVPAAEAARAEEVISWGADDFLPTPLVRAVVVQRLRLHTRARIPAQIDLPDLPAATASGQVAAIREEEVATHSGLRAARPIGDGLPLGIDGHYEQDMGCLIEVTEALASSLPTADALYVLVRRLSQSIPVSRCNITLRGVRPGEAVVVASHDDPALRRQTVELGRYPEVRRCFESGETVLIEDVGKDPEMEKVLDFITMVDLRSALVVPLFVREVVVATLGLTTRRENHGFTRRELLLVRAMANCAAGILSLSPLLEDVRRAALQPPPPPAAGEPPEEVTLDFDDQIVDLIEELDRK
jgi:CheY-like chemotaxis protein